MNEVIDSMIEIKLKKPEDFLKIRETLTRMGIANKTRDTLYQSCHILHKAGQYFICHFKQLFVLDGRDTTFDVEDQQRLVNVARLLHEWNLVDIVRPEQIDQPKMVGGLTVIPFSKKHEWKLVAKYTIGN